MWPAFAKVKLRADTFDVAQYGLGERADSLARAELPCPVAIKTHLRIGVGGVGLV